MPITLSCPCGQSLSVPDSMAGTTRKCPGCAASVRVPIPALATMPHGDAPEPLEFDEEPAGAPAKSSPPCPSCGTQYENSVVICVACGLNLLTGQPIGSGLSSEPFRPRRPAAHDEIDTENIGFWKMTLGVLRSPLQTLDSFGALFTRPEILAKAAVFYAASFVAVAVAAAFAARPGHNAGMQAAVEEVERVHQVATQVPQDWVEVKSTYDGLTEWGDPFAFKVLEPLDAIEAGKPFILRMLIMQPGRKKGLAGKMQVAQTPSHGNAPEGEWFELKRGTAEGEYVAEIPATRVGGTSYAFVATCEPDTDAGKRGCQRCCIHLAWAHRPGWGQLVLDDRQSRMADQARANGLPVPASQPAGGGLMGAAIGTAGMVAALVFNVLGLLISAAIFTGAARLLGGGGGFTLMLVTMAYLTGFSNFFQFLVLLAPLKLQVWFQAVLLIYGFSLQLAALMKVYDIDLLQALLTTVMAWSAKLLGAAYLAMVVLKIFGVA